MTNRLSLALAALLLVAAGPPQVVPPSVAPTGDASNTTVTATGGTVARTAAARAADRINVADFGAKCDGSTNDAAAINSAVAYARTLSHIGPDIAVNIDFPQGVCIANSSLNFTSLRSKAVLVQGHGTILWSKASGKIAVDAFDTQYIRFHDIKIQGDFSSPPKIGLAIGRIDTTANTSADNIDANSLSIEGYFTFAGLYNRNAETSAFSRLIVANAYPSTTKFGVVLDGLNHWVVASDFVTNNQPVDSPQSFNENVFINPDIRVLNGGVPIWMGHVTRHRWIGGYAASVSGPTGAVIYSIPLTGGDLLVDNTQIDMDVHYETGALTDVFLLSGTNTTPTLNGFKFRDQYPPGSNSVFKADSGITAVTMRNADVDIGGQAPGAKIFNAPGIWTVTGRIYTAYPAGWNLPATSFNGMLDLAGSLSLSGSLPIGSGLVQSGGTVSVSLPSPAPISQIAVSGSVASLSLTGNTGVYGGNGSGTYAIPTITFSAPPAGGTQATAHVTNMGLYSAPTIGGGTGYSVNDVLTVTGGTCSVAPQLKVLAVSSGAITSMTRLYPASPYDGNCTALPPMPAPLAGGTGSGATINNLGWEVIAWTVDSAGSGYTVAPTAAVTGAPSIYAATVQNFLTTLTNSFQASGGTGQLSLTNSGTSLGVNGATGSPVLNQGATIDASGIRISLTTGGYTVPRNTSLVRLTQTGTVASSTITLPPPLADGQPLQLVNYAGSVTALTFSPTVNGWTNGNQFAAFSGVRIRWDATAAAWYREQ